MNMKKEEGTGKSRRVTGRERVLTGEGTQIFAVSIVGGLYPPRFLIRGNPFS